MKRTFLDTGLLLGLLALLPPPEAAEAAARSRALRLTARDCSCNTGYGLVAPSSCGSSYSEKVQRMYEENPGQMISCCRPRHVQDYLIRCYNACGQPGRAVQNSRHVTGQACDATNGSIGRRYGLAYVPHHGSNHWQDSGGGGGGRGRGGGGGDDDSGDDDSGDDDSGDDDSGDDDSSEE